MRTPIVYLGTAMFFRERGGRPSMGGGTEVLLEHRSPACRGFGSLRA